MKSFLCALSIIFLTVIAHAQYRCGVCVGTSNNQFYNSACQGASVNGQQACENYSGLGCQWQAGSIVPGHCVGNGSNSYYDSACQAASVNGQQACENYSGLGCSWVAPYCH